MDRAPQFNYSVMPLTRPDAQKLGHVAWIEEDSLHSALTSMFNATNNGTANIAVWTNTQEMSKSADHALVSRWRRDFQLATYDISTGHIRREKLGKDIQRLNRIFIDMPSYSRKQPKQSRIFPEVNDTLHRRALNTVNALFQTMPVKSIALNVRAGPLDITQEPHKPHIDGTSSAGRLRLLDYIEGPAALFVSNDYVRKIQGRNSIRYEVANEPFWLFWACPPRSLVLIANDVHGQKPVAHSPAFTPSDTSSPIARANFAYDLYF